MRWMDTAIGFIGAGSMAEALIRGLRGAGMDGAQILATNRSRRERLEYLKTSWGIRVTPDKAEVCGATGRARIGSPAIAFVLQGWVIEPRQ